MFKYDGPRTTGRCKLIEQSGHQLQAQISSNGRVRFLLFLWHKQCPCRTNEHSTHLNLVRKPGWWMILKRETRSG
jgi:hypothetical protein